MTIMDGIDCQMEHGLVQRTIEIDITKEMMQLEHYLMKTKIRMEVKNIIKLNPKRKKIIRKRKHVKIKIRKELLKKENEKNPIKPNLKSKPKIVCL